MDDPDDRRPHIAGYKPCYEELVAGRRYLWCACGRSQRQPFCDGRSHLGTGFAPVAYTARQGGEEVLFCTCKHTSTPPFCDGTHNNLPGGYQQESPEAIATSVTPWAIDTVDGIRVLDAPCYVVRADATKPAISSTFWMRTLVDADRGAVFQSQFYLEIRDVSSPILSAGTAQIVLFATEGRGTLQIGTQRFAFGPTDGAIVLAGEAFRIAPAPDTTVKVFASVCPSIAALQRLDSMPPFDARHPVRVAQVDREQRKAMGPRFFQHLVDERFGAIESTQFIGHIPQSKAAMHRHLYEEALIIVSGHGVIWNEHTRAPVAAGDVIFFPRKHVHSLQCTAPEGMDVAGFIHPGRNPGINY